MRDDPKPFLLGSQLDSERARSRRDSQRYSRCAVLEYTEVTATASYSPRVPAA